MKLILRLLGFPVVSLETEHDEEWEEYDYIDNSQDASDFGFCLPSGNDEIDPYVEQA